MENEIIENETEPEVNDSEPTSEETGGSESSTDSIESPEPETPTETDDTSETENNTGNSDSTSESEEPVKTIQKKPRRPIRSERKIQRKIWMKVSHRMIPNLSTFMM